MFHKVSLSLSLALLLSTSSAFAMNDAEYEKEIVKVVQPVAIIVPPQPIENTSEQTLKFNAIIDLFEEQADYHKEMIRTLLKYKEDPLNNFWNIFGFTIDKASSKSPSAVPVEDAISNILQMHQSHANIYDSLAKGRKDIFNRNERPIFDQLAGIYYGAISNGHDAADAIKTLKKKFRKLGDSDAVKNHYKIKLYEDKRDFYRRVQKTLIEEFSTNEKEILSKLIPLCIKGKNDSRSNPIMQLSSDMLQFCLKVESNRYKFPPLESFSNLLLPADTREEHVIIKEKKVVETTSQAKTMTPPKNTKKNMKKKNKGHRGKVQPQVVKPHLSAPTPSESPVVSQVPQITEETIPEIEKISAQTRNNESVPIFIEPTPVPQIAKSDVSKDRKNEEKKIILPSMVETKFPSDHADVVKERRLQVAYDQLESGELHLAKHNYAEALENEIPDACDLEAIYAKDREQKKNKPQKIVDSLDIDEKLNLGFKDKKLKFLHKIFSHPINLKIRWNKVVSLFNGPSGFKGNVYGTKNGSANTFEVFLKFENGKFVTFLSEAEFRNLKKDAQRERLEDRKFLQENKRLQSYKLRHDLSKGNENSISIAATFFTLHNPHPNDCLYEALVERLQGQLRLLGITPEKVQGL